MNITIIGNKAVGKTQMVLALAESVPGQRVTLINPDPVVLKRKYSNQRDGSAAPTSNVVIQPLTLEVKLPSGVETIQVDWIDTPGEYFNPDYVSGHPEAWKTLVEKLSSSVGILLLLPPHSEQIIPGKAEPNDFSAAGQFANQLQYWMNLLRNKAPNVKHLLLCLHKGDLIIDVDTVGKEWQFNPSAYNWSKQQMNFYSYLTAADEVIREFNESSSTSLNYFVTTIHNRALLELPWIFLAAHLVFYQES